MRVDQLCENEYQIFIIKYTFKKSTLDIFSYILRDYFILISIVYKLELSIIEHQTMKRSLCEMKL